MGYYTHWYIRADVKPEYISALRAFIDTDEWPEDSPEFIKKWRQYLIRIGRIYAEDGPVDYDPPRGCSGHWGQRCDLKGSEFIVAGSTKNYNNEIEVFLCKVLAPLTTYIHHCYTVSEFTLDCHYSKKNKEYFDSDSDTELDDSWYSKLSDETIRTTSWRKLHV